jgi:hypothetical protein
MKSKCDRQDCVLVLAVCFGLKFLPPLSTLDAGSVSVALAVLPWGGGTVRTRGRARVATLQVGGV